MTTEYYVPARAVSILAQIPKPAVIVGIPGVAKTDFLMGLAGILSNLRQEPWGREVLIGSQIAEESINGVYVPEEHRKFVLRLPVGQVARLAAMPRGVFLLDEINNTTKRVGGALMGTIQNGIAGDTMLSPGIFRCGAMNPPWCGSGATRELTDPETNRVCFLPWETGGPVDMSERLDPVTKKPLPLNLRESHVFGLQYRVARQDYLRGGPGLFSSIIPVPHDWNTFVPRLMAIQAAFEEQFPHFTDQRSIPNQDRDLGENDRSIVKSADLGWPSSRSISSAFEALAACLACGENLTGDVARVIVRGFCGEAFMEAFMGWWPSLQVPDAEALHGMTADDAFAAIATLRNPGHVRLALDAFVASTARTLPDQKDRWKRAEKVTLKMLSTAYKDKAVVSSTMLMRLKPVGVSADDPNWALLGGVQDRILGIAQKVA
jgi:hypothetical protein